MPKTLDGGSKLYSRAEIGYRGGDGGRGIQKRDRVIIHTGVSGTGGGSVAKELGICRAYEAWHLKRNFNGIGYSFLVGDSGTAYEGRGWGQDGAHTQNGGNRLGHAICFIGDGTKAPPTRAAWDAAAALIREGQRAGHVTKDYRLSGHRDWWCVDTETEALTADGWKRYDEIEVGTEVLTLNPESGLSQWQPVQEVFRRHYDSVPMRSIEQRAHSSLSTLDHRWLVWGRSGSTYEESWRWRTTETLGEGRVPRAVLHDTDVVEAKYQDSLVELVAWYWTEGSASRNKAGVVNRAQIGQSHRVNPEHVESIHAALYCLFGSPGHPGSPDKPNPAMWYRSVSEKRGMTFFNLRQAAAQTLSSLAPGLDKVVAPGFIRSLTQAQLALFVDVSVKADGHVDKHGQIHLAQASNARLDSFSMACALLGLPTQSKRIEGDRWGGEMVGLSVAPKNRMVAPGRADATTDVDYEGVIWCPVTPNGTWLARRNGTVYYTGNTKECPGDHIYNRMHAELGPDRVNQQPAKEWDTMASQDEIREVVREEIHRALNTTANAVKIGDHFYPIANDIAGMAINAKAAKELAREARDAASR